jgi:hypothetical protein
MALITPAQFKEHHPGLVGTSEDTKLESYISRVDGLMASYLRFPPYDAASGARSLEDRTYTLHLDGPTPLQRDALCLCVHPIVSVTTVHVDRTRVYGASSLLVEGTDFSVDTDEGLLIRAYGSTWPVAWRGIRVVCVAGFATTPPELVALTVAAVRHLWDLQGVAGKSSYTVLGDSTERTDLDSLLPEAVRSGLDLYKRCA